MAKEFIEALNIISSFSENDNKTVEQCVEKITHYQWFQFALIPAILGALALAITKKRRSLLLHVLNGRPGLIFPMDSLTRTCRMSYACCFGATTFLMYQIVLSQQTAFPYHGTNTAARTSVQIVSMFIYGMVFFPLFVSLSVGSAYGYLIGTLYVWMLTIIEAYRNFQCIRHTESALLVFLRGLPSFLCLLYLCVSLPFRMVKAWRKGHYFHWREDRDMPNTIADIKDSYVGQHVTSLFSKPAVSQPPNQERGTIIGRLWSLAYRRSYKPKRGFRYPARMLSVLITAFIIVYMSTVEILVMGLQFFSAVVSYTERIKASLGDQPLPDDSRVQKLRVLITFFNVVKDSIIVSVVFAALFAVLNILYTLSSYRANLCALYRGDHSQIPPASTSRNTGHCVSSITYAGVQVGYIVWSYVIYFVFLWLFLFVMEMIIVFDLSKVIVYILQIIWPIVLTIVILWTSQFLLAKLVFLQNWGGVLALDNRSAYFNFTYFMFFYNVIVGLFSCVLRILKAMAVGVIFLGRLDRSALPRRFEFIDSGYTAYIGFMQMEAAHTHPVLLVFCRLMLLTLSDKRAREEGSGHENGGNKARSSHLDMSDLHSPTDVSILTAGSALSDAASTTTTTDTQEEDRGEKLHRRRMAARFHWHLTYTLLHNFGILVMRRGFHQQPPNMSATPGVQCHPRHRLERNRYGAGEGLQQVLTSVRGHQQLESPHVQVSPHGPPPPPPPPPPRNMVTQ